MDEFSCTRSGLYERNVGILRKYAPTVYKLINLRAVRIAGYEERNPEIKGTKNTAGNTAKLRESLSRSRATIYELALCNPWEFFVTLTLNTDKQDRYNLDAAVKKLSKWLNNLKYRENLNIEYLIIPEPHKDNAWHFHGLMMGIPISMLKPFTENDNIPKNLRELIRAGHTIYDFPLYRDKFGWATVEKLRNNENAAKYITKYITKDLHESRVSLNHHLFYASQGLKRSEVIYRAQLRQHFKADYENDYVRVKQFDNVEEPLKYFFDDENED